MAVEFRKEMRYCATLLNPLKEFKEDTVTIETRFDPLTGERCDLCSFRVGLPEKMDLSPMIAKSLERGCPFCPNYVGKVTPMFPPSLIPEGRLHRGQAWLIPNIAPWAEHNPLVIISEQHFVPMADFSPAMLTDAFLLSKAYYDKVKERDDKSRYWSVGWNYMPPSGGSQVHPHLQIIGQTIPSPLEERVFLASEKYRQENGAGFWQDLIEKERELGERYLGDIGNTTWLVNYVSRSWLFEVLTIFRERPTLDDITEEDWIAFADGLCRILKYMDAKEIWSLNLVLYFGMRETSNHFWTYSRLVPRFLYSPVQATDASIGRILHDWCSVFWQPEEICAELKPYFE
jgi:galactose-1-phosphate uridylyltransferase